MPLLLLPVSFLAGLLTFDGPMAGSVIPFLYVAAVLAILYRWVQRDSEKRKAKFSWPLRIGMVLLTVAALPYYFFKSRGWLGGLKLAALSWAIFVASMLCYRIGYSL